MHSPRRGACGHAAVCALNGRRAPLSLAFAFIAFGLVCHAFFFGFFFSPLYPTLAAAPYVDGFGGCRFFCIAARRLGG